MACTETPPKKRKCPEGRTRASAHAPRHLLSPCVAVGRSPLLPGLTHLPSPIKTQKKRLRPSASAPRLLQNLLDAVGTGRVRLETGVLLLAPLLHLRLHVHSSLLVLAVPLCESLLGLLLGVEDAEQVLHAEGVDGLGLIEFVGNTPVVPELTLLDGGNLLQLRQELLVDWRHRLAQVLRELSPHGPEHIRLRFVLVCGLRAEVCLDEVNVPLHLIPGRDVLLRELTHHLMPSLWQLLHQRLNLSLCVVFLIRFPRVAHHAFRVV